MALTQISTAGVKDDAVTAGKIPANAVGSSELADNAVDTAAIAADAVTGAKIAAGAINNANKLQDSIITGAKIGSGTITDGNLATNSVTTGKIANDAVTVDKVADDAIGVAQLSASGTASSSTFLRGDNAWTAVTSTTINNNADNRVITGSGTANTLNAESGVLYDGTNFGIGKTPSRTLDVAGKIRSSDSVCFGDNSSTPSEGAAIHRPAASTLGFVTNDSERMRITSAGKVGIGTSSPHRVFEINNSAPCIRLTNGTNAFDIGTGGFVDGSNSLVFFDEGAGERMRIDSSGKVGIGTTSPVGKLTVTSGNITLSDGYGFTNGADADKTFMAGTSGNSGHLAFGVNNTERLRLDSNGNLGLGTSTPTASSSSYNGALLHLHQTNSSSAGSQVKLTTGASGAAAGDGSIIAQWSDNNLYINNQESGNIQFYTGGASRARLDSDGLKFGSDTAAANALNDYEEGTWTPNLQGTSGNGTASYSTQSGTYTKVGDLVNLKAEITWSSGDAGGELRITNFPFSPQTSCHGIGTVMFYNVALGGDCKNIVLYIGGNDNYCYFYQSRSNQSWDSVNYDDNGSIIVNVTFRAN